MQQRRRPRRAPVSANALFGLEEESMIDDSEAGPSLNKSTDVHAGPVFNSYVPASQSLQPRPRRRFETQTPARREAILYGIDEDDVDGGAINQPAYKKYQAEFESNLLGGTLADQLEAEEMDLDESNFTRGPTRGETRSQIYSQSESGETSGRSKAGSKRKIRLSNVEEDEVAPLHASQEPLEKRRRTAQEVNTIAPPGTAPQPTPGLAHVIQPLSSNRQNLASAEATESSEKRDVAVGAAVTGVDTAPEFLQALASKKKGRRKEDAFDREFNNLRITMPKNEPLIPPGKDAAREILERERLRAEEMKIWDEIGKDMDIRGNFMVVIETDDILRKDGGRREAHVIDNGKPNFKKFKKVRSFQSIAQCGFSNNQPVTETCVNDDAHCGTFH
jgi:hypothetical protein